jgi:hypothetical protein
VRLLLARAFDSLAHCRVPRPFQNALASAQTLPAPTAEIEDDVTTNEHKAIESMMLMFGATDYADTDGFLDIASALDASPAFQQFSEETHVNSIVAAKLLIAGKMYECLK